MEPNDVISGRVTSRFRNRVLAVLGGFGAVVILVALGYVFSTSSSAQQVATNAQELHEANAAAGSAAIARASIAQAVVFSIDHELGVASTEARDAALTEATSTLDGTRHWVEVLTANPDTRDLGAELKYLVDTGDEVIDLLIAGGSMAAERIRTSSVEPLYAAVTDSLGIRQSEIVDEIHTTERFAGVVGWATKLIATLLIPAAAIILYFVIVRRQIREAEVKMDVRLRAERQLGVAKDEFIASISHELRTPLTSIYGFSEYLLENEILDPEEAMELIALINKDSAELSRMVDDLLTAARLESDALTFTYEYVDLRLETDSAIGAMIRAGTDVHVSGELLAWADPIRVRQIVRNLVSNAIKHGGSPVGVYIEESNDEAVITVSDSGDGLSSDIEDRLFDRFVHDGNESLLMGSVGLGLSIARSLAQTMGGDIRFVRASGWTNFEVVLPLKDAGITTTADHDHHPATRSAAHSQALLVGP